MDDPRILRLLALVAAGEPLARDLGRMAIDAATVKRLIAPSLGHDEQAIIAEYADLVLRLSVAPDALAAEHREGGLLCHSAI